MKASYGLSWLLGMRNSSSCLHEKVQTNGLNHDEYYLLCFISQPGVHYDIGNIFLVQGMLTGMFYFCQRKNIKHKQKMSSYFWFDIPWQGLIPYHDPSHIESTKAQWHNAKEILWNNYIHPIPHDSREDWSPKFHFEPFLAFYLFEDDTLVS